MSKWYSFDNDSNWLLLDDVLCDELERSLESGCGQVTASNGNRYDLSRMQELPSSGHIHPIR